MKKKISIMLCIVLFALTGCTTSGSTIRFGAADIGGMYYSFANTFTELANEQGYDFTCKVRTTAGSNANIRLLSDGYIEIGLAQADLIADAYKTNEDLRAIAGLYTETCQLVVRADSNIQTLDDLSGHTVSIGAEESGTERNATQILEFAGMPSSLVATKNLDYIEATKELKAGDIDAFFCTAGLTTTVIDELSKLSDKAFTALIPTPFKPTDFLKASESYFAPVFILDEASTSLPKGIPRPKSRTLTLRSSTLIVISVPAPMANSSMELSTTSFTKI